MEPISHTQHVDTAELTEPRRPDIFISYASDAQEWAEKLTSLLLRPGSQVVRTPLGDTHDKEMMRLVRGRRGYAGVVMLITPEYVQSTGVQNELSAFVEAGVQSLPVYGIRLVSGPIEHLRTPRGLEVNLLPGGVASVLESEDPDALLARIAAEIREEVDHHFLAMEARRESVDALGSPNAPAVSASWDAPDPLKELLSHYKMSYSVGAVLVHAGEYAAAASPPAVLSTSLVLLILAEHGARKSAPTWAGDWIRTRLGDAYDDMRAGYFEEKRIPGEARIGERVGALRAGIALTLDRAVALALQTTRTNEVRGRHLLAAMLTDERPNAGALKQLRRVGLSQADLRADLYDFVRAYGDDDEAWGDILLGRVAADARLSGFHADDSRSADYLDVRPDVEAFGKLIAARTVDPPLSIGLFGEWGSGKTFFMRMLQDEVNRLAQLADRSGRMQRDLPYWKRIIQIEFNAWHYVEGNLWASMVQHIFDNLRFAGETDRGVIKELQKHLVSQIHTEKAAETQALREQIDAQALVTAAEGDVREARTAFEVQAGELARLSASNFLADVPLQSVREAASDTLRTLGLNEVGHSAVDLRAALGEARVLLGRGLSVATPLLYAPDRKRRLVYLVLAIVTGPVVAISLGWFLTWGGQDRIAGIGAVSGGIAGALSMAAVWIRAQLARADKWIRTVENAQRELDEKVARAQAESLKEVRAAEEELRLCEADYQAAKRKEADAQRRAADAEMRLKEASVTELLTDFVETRANSTDYRKHLGTLALVRNDFEKLSEIIEAENWRLSPGKTGEERPFPKFETPEQEQRDRAKRINRIVLYIDDLDRCPPAKVVEVLQAVHLLLAFPLFVVVVGVDARWVVRSVETRYRELLRAGQGTGEHGAENNEFLARVGTATAHDYLEKIFQVPFWLRSMTDRACQAMVHGLLASSLPLEAGNPGPGFIPEALHDRAEKLPRREPNRDRGSAAEDRGEAAASPPTANRAANVTAARANQEPARETPPGGAAGQKDAEQKGSGEHDADLSPEALQIQPVEMRVIEELAPLLGRSPRALKRFVNVYRLIKASLTPYERQVFLRSDMLPDYQAVLFLLAVDTGAPSAASSVFRAIRDLSAPLFFKIPEEMRLAQPDVLSNGGSGAPRTLADLVKRLDADPKLRTDADWARVRHWLVAGDDIYRLPDDLGRLGRWVPRVSRYSFHTGRMERPHGRAVDPDALQTTART